MADNVIMVKRGGVTRFMTEKKFRKYYSDKGYRQATQEEKDAYNNASKKSVPKKKVDA